MLNAGGAVVRTIKGFPDEVFTADNGGIPHHYGYFSGLMNVNPSPGVYLPELNDTEPDIHFYNFGGKRGKIYFTNKTTAYTTDKSPFKIDGPYNGNNRFIITSEDGLIYTFEATEGGQHAAPSYQGWEFYFNYTASWYLTKIEDPVTNKSVLFQYRTDMPAFYQYVINKGKSESVTCGSTVGKAADFISNNIVANPKVLQKIIYSEGYIEFKANHSRQDLTGEKAYTEINQYVGTNTLKKGFNFSYAYVTSSSGTVQEDKRLYLESVQEKGSDNTLLPPYSFTYKNRDLLPSRLSPQQDVWGFYNANGATSFQFPKVYVKNYGDKRDFLPFNDIYNSSSSIITGTERSSNPLTIDYGTINKITYPTGGYTTYTYEIHQFDSYVGGGIRIKEIKDFSATGSRLLSKTFSYTNGTIGGAYPQVAYPIANSIPSSGVIRLTQSMSILGSCQGSNVGYEFVSEQQTNQADQGNGSIYRQYSIDKDVEGTFSIITNGCNAFASFSAPQNGPLDNTRARTYFPFFEMESREARRGNLLKEDYLDKDGISLKTINYGYTLLSEPITSLQSYFVIKVSDDVLPVEVLTGTRNLSIEKMLLTTKVESLNTGTAPQNSHPIINNTTSYTYTSGIYNGQFIRSQTQYRSNANLPDINNNNTTQQEIDNLIYNNYKQTTFKYPFDYASTASGGIMSRMVAMNYIEPVISQINSESRLVGSNAVTHYTDAKVTDYMQTPNSVSLVNSILPKAIYQLNTSVPIIQPNTAVEVTDPSNPGSLFDKRLEYLEYDYNANPLKLKHEKQYEVFEWSILGQLLSKKRTAVANAVTFSEPPQCWMLMNDVSAKTGGTDYVWDGNYIPFPFTIDGEHTTTVSFWAKGGSFTVNAVPGGQIDGFVVNQTAPSAWKYYTYTFQTIDRDWTDGLVYLTGTATLDDVIITTDPGQRTDYAYDAFHRLQSITEPNTRIRSFDYDVFSRLINTRDQDGKIIQHTDYNYKH